MLRSVASGRVAVRAFSRAFRSSSVARLDLAALSESLATADARAEIEAFKRARMDIGNLSNSVGDVKPIDWASYAQQVKTPGLVSAFKKAVEGLKPEAVSNPFVTELEQNFQALMKEAQEAAAFSEKELVNLEARLKELDASNDLSIVTIEEDGAKHPEIIAQIEKEQNNHQWLN